MKLPDALPDSWKPLLGEEINKPYFKALSAFVEKERAAFAVYPPEQEVFAAFEACPLEEVRVVLVGQDPYHGPGQAHGLCFSVRGQTSLPPSLKNIYQELAADLNTPLRTNGDLTSWAKQGILLLNTTLTVRRGLPLSHAKQGWEEFTTAVLRKLSELDRPLVFILWGNAAQAKYLESAPSPHPQHLVLKSAHPSPFSATKFFGSRPFSKTNAFLKTHRLLPIDFSL